MNPGNFRREGGSDIIESGWTAEAKPDDLSQAEALAQGL